MLNIRSLYINWGHDDLKLFCHPVPQKIIARIKQKNDDSDIWE